MNPLSLQEVHQQFIEWRQQKKYPREKIPKNLWKSAAQLIPKYSITKVTRTLKISATPLRQKIKKYQSPIDQSSKEVGFVEVNQTFSSNQSLSVPTPQSTIHCDRVEIQKKDGSRLTLYGQGGGPPQRNMLDGKALIKAFLGEKDAPNCTTD